MKLSNNFLKKTIWNHWGALIFNQEKQGKDKLSKLPYKNTKIHTDYHQLYEIYRGPSAILLWRTIRFSLSEQERDGN